MDFICIDLIGEFHPPTSRGHHYALTAVCMLTGFTWCVPLKNKDSRRSRESTHGPHLLQFWRKYQNTHGQWNRIQEQAVQGSRQ